MVVIQHLVNASEELAPTNPFLVLQAGRHHESHRTAEEPGAQLTGGLPTATQPLRD